MLVKRKTSPLTGSYRSIPLGSDGFALVDTFDYPRVSKYRWRLYRSQSCSYVARKIKVNGKERLVRLHRFIMSTLPGYECHHHNRNPKDCRRCNLENLTPAEHRAAHGKV